MAGEARAERRQDDGDPDPDGEHENRDPQRTVLLEGQGIASEETEQQASAMGPVVHEAEDEDAEDDPDPRLDHDAGCARVVEKLSPAAEVAVAEDELDADH